MPVELSTALMAARGTAAPDGSVTWPPMDPSTVCASPAHVANKNRNCANAPRMMGFMRESKVAGDETDKDPEPAAEVTVWRELLSRSAKCSPNSVRKSSLEQVPP